MKEITKDICIATRETLQASIGESIEVDGMPLGVTVGNITYSDDEMTVKVVIRAEHYKPDEVKDLERMLKIYTLDPNAKDAKGRRLYGYKPRRKKMPWILKDDAGKTFTCTDQYVSEFFWDFDRYTEEDGSGVISADRVCFLMRNESPIGRDADFYREMSALGDKLAKVGGAPAGKKKSKKKAARKSK